MGMAIRGLLEHSGKRAFNATVNGHRNVAQLKLLYVLHYK